MKTFRVPYHTKDMAAIGEVYLLIYYGIPLTDEEFLPA